MKIFAERLRDLRLEKGLTIRKLAQATGISDVAISRYENELRSPSAECLILLATYFGVSTDYLLGLED